MLGISLMRTPMSTDVDLPASIEADLYKCPESHGAADKVAKYENSTVLVSGRDTTQLHCCPLSEGRSELQLLRSYQ